MRFILAEHKEAVKFEQKNDIMKLIIKNSFESPERLLEFLIGFSKSVSKLFEYSITKENSSSHISS